MSHGTYMNESWHMYAWVMAHSHRKWNLRSTPSLPLSNDSFAWMNHGSYMNESWHMYEWVMAQSHRKDTFFRRPHCLPRMTNSFEWVMAHIWMNHGTYMNESWHMYEWKIFPTPSLPPSNDSFHVCHDSFHVCHDSFSCVPWLIHTETWIIASHWYVMNNSFVSRLIRKHRNFPTGTLIRHEWLIDMWNMNHRLRGDYSACGSQWVTFHMHEL